MFKPEMTVVRFDAEDILTASGTPSLYYVFSGLGKDKLASDGTNLSITYQGNNVTSDFYKQNYDVYIGLPDVVISYLYTAENYITSEFLANYGISDGEYELSEHLSRPWFKPVSGK